MLLTLNSLATRDSAVSEVIALWEKHKYLRLVVKTGKARSNDQNSFSHAWYQEIADFLPDDDALGWKCYCKLHHGVPILRAEDPFFRESYDSAIKGLSYEQKLKVMRILPVTSLMIKAQLTKYAAAVQDDFLGRGLVLVVKKVKPE